jgi:hypothetical protein
MTRLVLWVIQGHYILNGGQYRTCELICGLDIKTSGHNHLATSDRNSEIHILLVSGLILGNVLISP